MTNTHLIKTSLIATSAIGLCLAMPAFASGAPADQAAPAPAPAKPVSNEGDPQDIIVQARRVDERLQDVPISITVFNQAQLSNRNIVNPTDLVAYTPSLSSNGRFGAEGASFAIRGFTQDQNTSPSVGTYFAEVVSPRANGGTTNGNGAAPGSFFDLQNVQVLKGPQGTLFGRNTTGGSVLLVPQKPTDKFEGYLEGSFGDYGMIRTQAVINIPISDTVRFRLGGDRMTRDGYLHNLPNGQPGAVAVGPKDFGDVNYYALRGSLDIDVTPNIENYTIATYSDSETNGNIPKMFCVVNSANLCIAPTSAADPTLTGYRARAYATQILATPGFYDVSNSDANAHQTILQWQAINTTVWKVSDSLTLKNIISYAQFRQRQDEAIYGDGGLDPTTGQINYAVSLIPPAGKWNTAESTFTEELQLQGHTDGDRFVYQVGGYLEIANPLDGFQTTYSPSFVSCTDPLNLQCTDARGASIGAAGRVGSVSISRSQYRFNNKALYAQATYKIFDPLSITAGFRYTWDDVQGLGQSTKITFFAPNVPTYNCSQPVPQVAGGTSAQVLADPSVCNFARESKSSKPTWLIDLDYKVTQDILLYGKYARGYRQGGVNVASYGLETWKPEQVDTYEIGAKTGFRGDVVSGTFNLAAFYNDFTNQQIAIGLQACSSVSVVPNCPFVPASAAGIANAGKSTIKGIELETSLTFFKSFRFDGGYSHLDSKIDSIQPVAIPLGFIAAFPPVAGGRITLTPLNQYTLTGTYTLPIDPSLGHLSVGLTYSHRDSAVGSTSSKVAQQILPPQNLLNLNINWNDVGSLPLDLSFFVTNLANAKFYTFTTGASFGFDSYVANQPRMLGVRAKVHFGK